MPRNLIFALLAIATLAVALIGLQGGPATAQASACDPGIPCACCFEGCSADYDDCIAAGNKLKFCEAQRQACFHDCRFCV